MNAFTIDLAGLRSGTSHVRLEAQPGDLGLPPDEWSGSVVGSLGIDRNGDRISVRGKVEALARVDCVRCLRSLELAVEAPLEVFADRSGSGSRSDEKELERDDYMLFHDGRNLALSEEAREALILEVPIAPRCREDCRGLCPRCGADLNQGTCDCAARGAAAG